MRNLLEQAVIALAQPADVQLTLFPNYVCKVDELVLNFEDGLYEVVGHEHELTTAQHDAVERLNTLLSTMSGKHKSGLWTEDALRTHPAWEQVRREAQKVSIAFGWNGRKPSGPSAIYVSCG